MDALSMIANQRQSELRAEASRQRMARPNPLQSAITALVALLGSFR